MKRLSVAVMFLLVLRLHAQTTAPQVSASFCQPSDIDATFFFADSPVAHQTIAINLRNTSQQPCTLRGELIPSFAVDSHSAIVDTCYVCTANGRSDAEAIRRNNNFALAAGDSAHVRYQWTSTGDVCQRIDWMTLYADWGTKTGYLFSPNRWKPTVCSTMQISGYEPGPIPESLPPAGTEATIQLTLPAAPIYGDEFAPLTLELKSPNASVSPTDGCPELYVMMGDGTNSNRLEPIYPDDSRLVPNASVQPSMKTGKPAPLVQTELKGYTRVCDTTGARSSTVVTLPASMLAHLHVSPTPTLANIRHILWRAESNVTDEPVFISVDPHVTVLDPTTLAPHWGPQVQGIGAGLSVDKTTFTLGEDIAIHLHWENFGATQPLGVDECGNPRATLELQDVDHHVLQTLDRFELDCNSHGWGPFAVEVGKPHHDFLSIAGPKPGYSLVHVLETRTIQTPGVYYLVSLWSPSTLIQKPANFGSDFTGTNMTFGPLYATARSAPVRIEILPSTLSR